MGPMPYVWPTPGSGVPKKPKPWPTPFSTFIVLKIDIVLSISNSARWSLVALSGACGLPQADFFGRFGRCLVPHQRRIGCVLLEFFYGKARKKTGWASPAQGFAGVGCHTHSCAAAQIRLGANGLYLYLGTPEPGVGRMYTCTVSVSCTRVRV